MKRHPIHHDDGAYRLADDTDVAATWRRHGFVPTTHAQRVAQQQPKPAAARKRKHRASTQPTPLRAVGGGK